MYPPQYYQGTPYQGYPGYYPPPPPPRKEGPNALLWVGVGVGISFGVGKLLELGKAKQGDLQQAMMQQMLKSMMASLPPSRPFPAHHRRTHARARTCRP